MNKEMPSWLEELNPRQREAVEHEAGPLLVLAGAGSGKTRVIVHRIAHLIRVRGVPPWAILALTFTNKAAEEMQERVVRLLGDESARVWVSTFHKFGAAVLRRHMDKLGRSSSFVIYDEADQVSLLKQVLREHDLDPKEVNPQVVQAAVERLKREAVPEEEWGKVKDRAVAQYLPVLRTYQEKLRASQAVDFSDLLYLTHQLFSDFPQLLAEYHRRFHHFLVDEYQDTNHIQYLLVRQLAAPRGNLCVVGDEDQSIYGWRGANIRNILDFERDFPGARVILLEQNYRSTKTIISAASGLISANRSRKPKQLWTDNPPGGPIRLYVAEDEQAEARWVVEDFLRQRSRGRKWSDMAVFYRTHAQSRVLEDMLRKSNISYKVYGGLRFYDRKEIKDILAYLQFLANPADEVSFLRILNNPPRGLGARTQEMLLAARAEAGGDWLEVISGLLASPRLSARAERALREFMAMMRELQQGFASSVTELVQMVIRRSGYQEALEKEGGFEAEARLENLEELVNAVAEYERTDPAPTVQGFLEQVSLAAEIDGYDAGEGLLSLMTLHNAKGLEFPVVYIVGMSEGLLPHSRSIWSEEEGDDSLEEERRLCYVGMTRARQELILTWSCWRQVQGWPQPAEPSRFLDEIPAGFLQPVGPRGGRKSVDRKEKKAAAEPKRRHFGDSEIVYEADSGGEPERAAGVSFKPGDRVFHPYYGEGVVKRVEEIGKHAKIVVRFQDGSRKFSAAFNPLIPRE